MSVPPTQKQWTLTPAPTATSSKALKLTRVAAAPVPTLTSPRCVLLRVRAVCLAARDLQIIKGIYPAPHDILDDLVPVGSGAGEVVAVGAAVTGWAVGDRCIPLSMPGHHDAPDLQQASLAESLGGGRHGLAQEYLVVDCSDLLSVPAHLSWDEAAAVSGSASTAWVSLFCHTPQLLPGGTALVLGTGGVSLFAAQFALLAGANVIITSSSDAKLATLTQLLQPLLNPTAGPDAIRTINYNTDNHWEKAVLAMTEGRGVDCVVEVAGWATVGKSVRCTRKGGIVAVSGYLSTYNKVPDEIVQQDLSKMILYSAANVRGVFVGNRTQSQQMMRAVQRAGMQPILAHVFEFDELPKAYEALEQAAHMGKIIVRVAASASSYQTVAASC